MWTAILSGFGKILPSLVKIGGKGLDVKHLKKATSKFVQEVEKAEKDGIVTGSEWLKIFARFIEQLAIGIQAVKK